MTHRLIFILTLLLNYTVVICSAQKKHLFTTDSKGFIHVDTTRSHFYIPTVVEQGNSKPFMVRFIIAVKEDCIYNGLYKPQSEAVQLYGKEDLIRIILKPEVKVLSFEDLLKKYHIHKRYRKLPVFVDKHQLYPIQPLMATEHSIDTIEIVNDPDSNEQFISIITNI